MPRPRLVVATLLVIAAASAAAAHRWLPEPAPAPVRPTLAQEGPREPAGWGAVLTALDARRVRALETVDPRSLAELTEPGSALARADRAALERLRRSGLHPAGLSWQVDHVGVRSTGANRVVLRVVDSRPAYVLVRLDGTIARRVPARGARAWTVTLTRLAGQWRTASVTPLR